MEHELDLVLGTVIDSLAKISMLFFLRERPATAVTPDVIASHVGRQPEHVRYALEQLGEAKFVTRFPVGRGRIVLYGPAEDARILEMIELLYSRYHESDARRAEIMRKVLHRRNGEAAPRLE